MGVRFEYSCTKGGIRVKQPDIHGAKRFIRPITYGILCGATECFLLLIIMSILMSFKDIPQSAVSLISTLTFVCGGFVAGLAASSFSREKGMFLGLCCGLCLFLVLSLASLAVDGSGFGMVALTKLIAVLFAAAIGGVIGVNRKKKFK